MSRAVLRYWLVVDGEPKILHVAGDPLHVAADRLGSGLDAKHIVEFWAEGDAPSTPVAELRADPRRRVFVVVGTGQPLPDGAVWRGTCDRTEEGLVWHLYELPAEPVSLPGGAR